MHPAYSVIFFTTMSGAGYGLLVWLAGLALAGAIPIDTTLGLIGFGAAFLLIALGLLSSTAHLGRPERAWRAFSQWTTSWLSREGVLAMVTFLPAGLLAVGWVFYEQLSTPLALATIALSLATVFATGMIYQSLPTIRAWAHPLVAPLYVVLAVATGGVLAMLLIRIGQLPALGPGVVAVAALVAAAALKSAYWSTIDGAVRTHTIGAATGLGHLGTVRPLQAPHSMANFVMREMGYGVARKHAEKLRRIALWLGLLVPALLTALSLAAAPGFALTLAILALLSMTVGIVTERWLFFAEAQHVVTLYYGAATA
jgi:DMSO reductase anchor subunit